MFKKFLFILSIIILIFSITSCSEPTFITVGTDPSFPPFESLEESKLVGFDIDLMEAIAEHGNYCITWKQMGWGDLFSSLEDGTVDAVIAGVTITLERKTYMLFTDPYYDTGGGEMYAIALPLTSIEIQEHFNEILSGLLNDGTIEDMMNNYGL